jgi:creatinine amidohydrolase
VDQISLVNMMNMKWTEVQNAVDNQSIVLLPLGVIEEHGPQLCLATDIYTANVHCYYVKEKLGEMGIRAILAPPFYWGICQSTGGFIGSFRIRKETATNLLVDIFSSLKDFGFTEVYGINAHGDIDQNIVIIEAFREASEKLNITARYCFRKEVMHHYGITGDEPFICPIEPQEMVVSMSEEPDVHAGDIETATIFRFYPELVDVGLAKKLPPVKLSDDQGMEWLWGGKIKELSQDGYIGNPSKYDSVDVMGNIEDIANRIVTGILHKRQTA